MASVVSDGQITDRPSVVSPRLFDVAWLALLALALVSGACMVAGLSARYRELRADVLDDPAMLAGARHYGLSVRFVSLYQLVIMLAAGAVCLAVAAVIGKRRPRQPMALLGALMLISLGVGLPDSLRVLGYSQPAVAWLNAVVGAITTESLLLVLWLFPDGRFVPRWTRWLALFSLCAIVVPALLGRTALTMDSWPDRLFIPVSAVLFLSGLLPQIYRYRQLSNATARQQAKWVTLGIVIAVTGLIGGVAVVAGSHVLDGNVLLSMAAVLLIIVSVLPIPLSIVVAILRYRLWDINLFINRALVYGSLTAILTGLFTALIALFEQLFRAQMGGSSYLALVFSTLIVAGSFTPIKNGVQSLVDRRFKPVPGQLPPLPAADPPSRDAVTSADGSRLDEVLAQLAALRGELTERAETENALREQMARLEQEIALVREHRLSDD